MVNQLTITNFGTMRKLTYVTGDATAPIGDGKKLIIHCCNDIGAWGAGFVMALSAKWEAPEAYYRALRHYELGNIQTVDVEDDIIVVNMIGQHGCGPDKEGIPPVRYGAIAHALKMVNVIAKELNATVHCPKFGSDLAGGDWKFIEALLMEIMSVPVTVYNFER